MLGETLAAGRRRRFRRRAIAIGGLLAVLALGFGASLMIGDRVYGPGTVLAVLFGEPIPGASFTVGELRLPQATLALLGGFAFGIAGATFQTLLGNPLASPDILGVSAGAGTAAVFAIVVLGLDETATAAFALAGAILTAAAIFGFSHTAGFVGARFILIGIGLAAMLQSATSYLLARAAEWDIQSAMQWLSGSVSGATWERILPLAIASAALVPVLVVLGKPLDLLRLGPDTATTLGAPVPRIRVVLVLASVALLAFATAACGPILFVAFMAGPIAARLSGPGAPVLLPAGLTGAALVLLADLIGQNLLAERYPVGVITGVVGAPYLILLLIRFNRTGRA